MKKVLLFVLLCFIAFTLDAQRCAVLEFKAGVGVSQADVDGISAMKKGEMLPSVPAGYVDLGLPSGTLWKSANEKGVFYTYDEAISKFGDNLPTREQWEELKGMCTWTWTGKGYKVTGDNGNSIVLPAAGYRGCGGGVNGVGFYGYYWSSTPYDSSYAWCLDFYSGKVDMGSYIRCGGRSVRLVQD